ncbi:MAG: methyltransferase domain-containing protein [Taibaiella sp.]|nr:methyltransferase domain-containing protein [Taibaiella sp.]
MPSFGDRSTLLEKMDDPAVAAEDTQRALREVAFINKHLGGYKLVLNALKHMSWPLKEVSILDVGCGGGDMLCMIAAWAIRKKKRVMLTGIDWNQVMVDFAQKRSAYYPGIQFKKISVFDDALMDQQSDIVINSLFCHHFDKDALVVLVKRMYQLAGNAVIINDLERNWFAYYAIKGLTRVFSKSYLVKYDAPLSVARALTRREWEEILSLAGITNYTLSRKWAWRWEIILKK